MNTAIILAGGVGSRVGAGKPKQFIDILGKPVLVYTIEAFQNHPLIDSIEIVCIESHIDYLKECINKFNLSKVKWVTKGGKDFQHSVMNGIRNLKETLNDDDIILVHYGASPFVTEDIITDCIRVAKEKGNSVSASPCYLLYGSNDDGTKSTKWIDRDKIMQLNAPQCFKFKYACDLYNEAVKKNLIDKVEPHTTSLMYLMNRTIYFAKGNQINIKITTPEDVKLFECYVKAKENNGENI